MKPADAILVAHDLGVRASLTSLNLYWNNFGADGAKALAEALKVNASLTSLDLRHNYIGDDGAKALATALKVNDSLCSPSAAWSPPLSGQTV